MGASEEYKIEAAPIPLEERVKIEEQQLLTMIHQLNVSKKNSEDDSSDEDNLKGGNFSKRINNLSLSTLSDEIEIDENFINQNVITYDDFIKNSNIRTVRTKTYYSRKGFVRQSGVPFGTRRFQ